MKGKLIVIGAIIVVLLGCSILAYPTVMRTISSESASILVERNVQKATKFTKEEQEAEFEKAREFNEKIFDSCEMKQAMQCYYDILDYDDGIMGSIEIPSIGVNLPIYHSVDDQSIRKGIGHYEYSSLPIGEINTHSVFTSHTGLPEASLLTDLHKMKIGDRFFVTIMNVTTEYVVEAIDVVTPEEIGNIVPIEGKCCVSLFTCTPYGINSHRLVVRGVLVDQHEDVETNTFISETITDIDSKIQKRNAIIIASVAVLFAIAIVAVIIIRKHKARENIL